MGKLVIVGLGVHGAWGMPVGALEELRSCSRILLDGYTTPVDAERLAEELKSLIGGAEITVAGRELLEDASRIVRMASSGCLGVIVPGDVFIATTHEILRQEAVKSGVPVSVWHSSSVVNAALERIGLHVYKLGFVGTVVKGPPQTAYRVYFGVNRALLNSSHSILLLEYNASDRTYVTVPEAAKILLEAEKSWKTGTFTEDRVIIVVSRLYMADEKIEVTRLEEALNLKPGKPPYTIIVPGSLHYTELETLRLVLGEEKHGLLREAGRKPASICERLALNAIEKTRRALSKLSVEGSARLAELVDNVKCYIDDAERFLGSGDCELAIAEGGYAEGLLDALRLLRIADVRW